MIKYSCTYHTNNEISIMHRYADKYVYWWNLYGSASDCTHAVLTSYIIKSCYDRFAHKPTLFHLTWLFCHHNCLYYHSWTVLQWAQLVWVFKIHQSSCLQIWLIECYLLQFEIFLEVMYIILMCLVLCPILWTEAISNPPKFSTNSLHFTIGVTIMLLSYSLRISSMRFMIGIFS